MAPGDLELDWKSEAILAALEEVDREATTTELSDLTGIEDNRHILYRLREKLAANGLVEIAQSDAQAGGGQIPPTQARLTSEGEELAQEIDEERNQVSDVTERIEQIEADLNKVEHAQTELTELQARIESIEGASGGGHSGEDEAIATEIEELNQRVGFLWDAVLAIRNFLETEHNIDLKEYIEDTETDGPSLGTDQ